MKPLYITENFDAAAKRVPQLEALRHGKIDDTLAPALELVDCMPGYELFQFIEPKVRGGVAFVFRRLGELP